MYFAIILTSVLGLFLLDLVASLLNKSTIRTPVPDSIRDAIDDKTYKKTQDYTRTQSSFGLVQMTFSLIVFLIFWLTGGFGVLDNYLRAQIENEIVRGLTYMSVLMALQFLISLPWALYSTFVIEEKFGFNKSTLKTFVSDQLKGIVLFAIIGLPVLALLLWFFGYYQDKAWLAAWGFITAFSLLMSYIAPTWIMPLFNKFSPLEEGSLKEKIFKMADKAKFTVTEIYIMDGSKRSSKSNAFFTGFGKNKRIALFDTLVEKHTEEELLAVLAHEIGHFKKKHVIQMMIFSILQTGLMLFLLNLFITEEALFKAFMVDNKSVYAGMIFFSVLYKPVSQIFSVLNSILSRKNEYEADAFATQMQHTPVHMTTALKKLSVDNLSHQTPHWFYVFMNYSHPPVFKRLEALERFQQQ